MNKLPALVMAAAAIGVLATIPMAAIAAPITYDFAGAVASNQALGGSHVEPDPELPVGRALLPVLWFRMVAARSSGWAAEALSAQVRGSPGDDLRGRWRAHRIRW